MIMPMPNGRYNDITSNKRHLLPFNCCETLSINNEAGRKGKMSMRWCRLTGVDDL